MTRRKFNRMVRNRPSDPLPVVTSPVVTAVKRGRKSSYQSDFLRQVYLLSLLGARDQDIAEFFCVDQTTIDSWKQTKPDFLEAMRRGKWKFDFLVVEQLGRRALGYDYVEKEISERLTKFGKVKLSRTTTRHVPADVTAQIFWLKNRQREFWVDVNRTEFKGELNLTTKRQLDLSPLSEKERQFVRSICIKQLAIQDGVILNNG